MMMMEMIMINESAFTVTNNRHYVFAVVALNIALYLVSIFVNSWWEFL